MTKKKPTLASQKIEIDNLKAALSKAYADIDRLNKPRFWPFRKK